MKNIILIGMPACGKSSVGVILAKTAAMSFVDTDLLLQEKEGRKLQYIIDDQGLDEFSVNPETWIVHQLLEFQLIFWHVHLPPA